MPRRDTSTSVPDRHEQAFETYYSLGPKRTYQQAADKLGLSGSTIKLWSRTQNWRQRIQERDAESSRQLADQSGQVVLEERARDLKLVRMAKVKLARDILEGRVKGNLRDLEMLFRLETELSGGVDAHLGWIDRESDPEKLRARLREIAAAELPPENPPSWPSTDG